MLLNIPFLKYHNNQNFFIIIDERKNSINSSKPDFVKRISKEYYIGANTVLFINNSCIADISCTFYDSDGTVASMCGNGMLCVGDYFKKLNKKSLTVETVDNIISLNMEGNYICIENIPVKLIKEKQKLNIKDFVFDVYHINSTFPHFVVILNKNIDLEFIKKELIESFKLRLDVSLNCINFLKIDTNEILTYEKGVGFTDSCGTGTLASAYVLHNYLTNQNEIVLKSKGGINKVNIINDNYYLIGNPTFVCTGEYYYDE